MSQWILPIVIIFSAGLVAWFMWRNTQKQIQRVLQGERTMDDKDTWLKGIPPSTAKVISIKETIKPEAKGIARVDLELQLEMVDASPIQARTTWLVELPFLPELQAGKIVQVKFDPKKPERIFPAVSWARLWLFGNK